MQNSPQSSCQIWTQLEILSLLLLFVPSLKQLSKKMKVKNVTLLLSTLPPQPCVGATLQHWWKTTSFEYIALKKAWQHWTSRQTSCCTSTQVSEDRYKHKRPKKTRWGIPVTKPSELCHFCTCWTNIPSPEIVPSGFFLSAPAPWPSGWVTFTLSNTASAKDSQTLQESVFKATILIAGFIDILMETCPAPTPWGSLGDPITSFAEVLQKEHCLVINMTLGAVWQATTGRSL